MDWSDVFDIDDEEDDEEEDNSGAFAFSSASAAVDVASDEGDIADDGNCDRVDEDWDEGDAGDAEVLVIGDMKGRNAKDEIVCPSTPTQVERVFSFLSICLH